jgi:hypothetical protein
MKNACVRNSTPIISYVGVVSGKACFRLHLLKADPLDGLLYRGEIVEFLMKEGIGHKISNDMPEVRHLENPKKADYFILIERDAMGQFADNFEVRGFMPALLD